MQYMMLYGEIKSNGDRCHIWCNWLDDININNNNELALCMQSNPLLCSCCTVVTVVRSLLRECQMLQFEGIISIRTTNTTLRKGFSGLEPTREDLKPATIVRSI